MVLAATFLTLSLLQKPQAKPISAWEKRLAPGVTFRMVWDQATPRTIFALRLNLRTQAFRPMAELGGHTVYEDNASKGRATVSEMVRDDKAFAGINADFFPFTGLPLNLTVRDGEFLSAPFVAKGEPGVGRASFGVGPGFAAPGFAKLTCSLEAPGVNLPIKGWNAEAEPDTVTLNTPSAGLAKGAAPNAYAIVKTDGAVWSQNSTVHGTVSEVGNDLVVRPVEKYTFILVATGNMRDKLLALEEGQSVTVRTAVSGFDWNKVTNVVSGGPVLVQHGQVNVDWAAERLKEDFAKKRHPRTAIGVTAHNDLWLVVVDGRSKISDGATLDEMAGIMKSLGCEEAINLDGGGSSTMNILGETVNRPSDGTERPVANGLLILGQPVAESDEALSLPDAAHAFSPGEKVALFVRKKGSRRAVPNSDVLWNATGAAWIDQGGTLHLRGAGQIEVTAIVHGRVLHAKYQATGPDPEPAKGFSAGD